MLTVMPKPFVRVAAVISFFTNNKKRIPSGILSFYLWIWDSKGRSERSEGKKVSGGHFLVRGRIPAHLTAPRRGVGKCAIGSHPAWNEHPRYLT